MAHYYKKGFSNYQNLKISKQHAAAASPSPPPLRIFIEMDFCFNVNFGSTNLIRVWIVVFSKISFVFRYCGYDYRLVRHGSRRWSTIEQNPFWERGGRSPGQDITRLLWNLKIRYRVT
jgi:hypothetical protein